MEPVHFSLPGYRVNEYMLVLQPHEELCQRIQKIKEAFSEKFKLPRVRSMRPHISLVHFQALEMVEEKLVHRIQNIAMGIAPFKLELKDYGSFPTHSIVINVTSRLPVEQLVRQLKTAQALMKLNAEHRPNFIMEPYILLARKLKPWQYEQAWLEYAARQFTGRFIANRMLLLRRPDGERGAFQVAGGFDFLNLPVMTKQASMFG